MSSFISHTYTRTNLSSSLPPIYIISLWSQTSLYLLHWIMASQVSSQLCLERSQQEWAHGHKKDFVQRSLTRAQALKLKQGDIVFLKHAQFFNSHDYKCLVETGYLPEKATGHPVILLRHAPGSTHAIITTISAYSSGEWNNNLAPWKQRRHSSKKRVDFRAFQGSEQPDKTRSLLQLEDGKLMPKPEVSWIYTKNAYVVPVSTIGHYDKSPTRLRMTQQSFNSLCDHMFEVPYIKSLVQDPRLSYTLLNSRINAPTITQPSTAVTSISKPCSTESNKTTPISGNIYFSKNNYIDRRRAWCAIPTITISRQRSVSVK